MLAVVACIYLLWPPPAPHAEKPRELPPGNSQNAAPTSAISRAMERQMETLKKAGDALTGTNPNVRLTEKDLDRMAMEFILKNAGQGAWEWKMPIEFYGKVVDEKMQPVPGAAVYCQWNDTSRTGTSETNLVSDLDGRFSLAGVTGKRLQVRVSKSGYYTSISSNRVSFEYARTYEPEFHRPDIANPVLFHLRKQGPGTELITSQRGVVPRLGVSSDAAGQVTMVDLLQQKVGSEGQLRFQKWWEPKDFKVGKNNWAIRIEIPDGGFIEHNDEYPFLAPESGYQPMFEFRFSKNDTNWVGGINRKYYIRFGSPPRYGRLQISTSAFTSGASFEYAINPDGGRNLEPIEKSPTVPTVPR